MYIYVYIYIYIYTQAYLWKYTYAYIHSYAQNYMHAYTNKCGDIRTQIKTCLYMYQFISIQTHALTQRYILMCTTRYVH